MEDITISYEQLERIIQQSAVKIIETIHDRKLEEFASKYYVSKGDIVNHFDDASYKYLTKVINLQPVRSNGRGGKTYYSTKKVLHYLGNWYHLRKPMKPHR